MSFPTLSGNLSPYKITLLSTIQTQKKAPILLSSKNYSKVKHENECVAISKMVNMTFKKLNRNLCKFTYSILLCISILRFDQIHSMVSDCDDEFDFLLNDFSPADFEKVRSCETGEATTWNDFLTIAKIPEALNSAFYLQTELPRTHNLINYPEWQICTYQDMNNINQFTFHAFYNQTSKKNYTKTENDIDGTRMGSYLNIEHGTFLSLLEAALSAPNIPPSVLAPLKNLNYPLVFNNLANARLEERRMGFLAHFYHKMNKLTYLEIKTPFLWMIKNLQFSQKDKDSIAAQFTAFLGTNFSNFDELSFAKKHTIFDALGVGTTELSLCTKFFERSNWSIDGGAFLLLPTDCQVKRGLYGTYIEPKNQNPLLPLCQLVKITTLPPSISPNFAAIMNSYFIAALDQLSSMILQCPLGYNQSFGVGFKLSPYWKPHENLEFNTLYSVEILMPDDQLRFFVPINTGNFADEYNALPENNDTESEAKLLFLEQRLTELLFPRVFTTKVFPGFVINSTTSIQKSYKEWDVTLGYNGWFQSGEQFLSVDLPREVKLEDFDLDKSITQDAYLIKLFAKVHKDIHLARHDLSFTAWGDASIFSNTVGNDFTLGVSFDAKF
jgi:hypothetical protein